MALKRALLAALLAVMATTGVAYAAFSAQLLSAGITDDTQVRAFLNSFKDMRSQDSTQLRIIDVTLDSAGTGWHTHPGTPSLLIVKQGTIDYIAPDHTGACETRRLNQGEMIFHPSAVHDLRAVGANAVFTVIYFSEPSVVLTHPTGAPC